MRARLAVPLAGLFAFGLIGCEKKSPNIHAGDKPPVKKLEIEEVEVGDGAVADEGDYASVLYTGQFGDGTIFDSSEKQGNKPYSFQIGAGSVIKGWDAGVKGMKVGGTRYLSIPYEMGYGKNGSDTMPPEADLYFTIILLDVVKKGQEEAYEITETKEGKGPAAKMGDTVTIDYVASLVNDKVVDNQKDLTFKLGIAGEESIRGLAEGITGMKVGGVRDLKLPPPLAFGSEGRGPIPSDAVLRVKVTLKALK
jgi:FKBP-type peptidyl-prolyl cis-trans isomerase